MKTVTLALGTLLLTAGVSGAGDSDQWLHVAVDGTGSQSERVRVNLPLTLIEAVLPLIETHEFQGGKVRIDHQELSHDEIVTILDAVRDAAEGEYVTVEDGRDYVRVAKDGKYLTVHVEERHDAGDRVDVRVPISVLDALVSGEDELDVLAALEALGEHEDETFVMVQEPDATVRIWIDRQNESD